MTHMLKSLFVAAAVIAAPAVATAGPAPRDTPEVQLQKAIGDRVPGKPVSCIDLRSSQSSQVIDKKAIVYRSGSKLYVNVPRSGAERLDDDDLLVTSTFGSQLCRNDPVHLVNRGMRYPTGFVQLGDFVPYTKVKAQR
jgi:hypothetical protein